MNRTIMTLPALILWALPLSAAQFYVATNGDDGNPGTLEEPWRTLDKANQVLEPGDIVFLRGGEYYETIQPVRSGQAGQYITYKAYPGETPVITKVNTAVVLDGRDYINVDGLTIDGKDGWTDSDIEHWVSMKNAHYNIVQRGNFKFAKGWGIWLDEGSHHNKILNNRMDHAGTYDAGGSNPDKGDMVVVACAFSNLLEGNHLTRGGHNLFDVAGYNNVLRNNIFDNKWFEGKGNRNGDLSGNVKKRCASGLRGYNLFEGNIVRNTLPSADNPTPATIKVQSMGQIVRGNFVYDNPDSMAIVSAIRPEAITEVTDLKIYHNVFYNNGFLWEMRDQDNTAPADGNVFKNNIVYGNNTDKDITLSVEHNADVNGRNKLNDNFFIANAFKQSSGETTIAVEGIGDKPLDWYQQSFPENVSKNIEEAPRFVISNPRDPDDFRLSADSPLIDRGDFLTVATGSGSGTIISVEDAGYFCDGFGIVEGDRIQVGLNAPVRITAVDYERNRITVEQLINWGAGDGVSLPYNGTAPDIGAYESGEEGISRPQTPTNLQLSASQ